METNCAFCWTLPGDVRLVSHVCNGEAVSGAYRPGRSQSRWICGWLYPCWGSHLQKPRLCPLLVLLAQFVGSNQVKKWHDVNSYVNSWFMVQWQKIGLNWEPLTVYCKRFKKTEYDKKNSLMGFTPVSTSSFIIIIGITFNETCFWSDLFPAGLITTCSCQRTWPVWVRPSVGRMIYWILIRKMFLVKEAS